ncbi:MAG: TIGR03435 family protein [Acidobacteriota bacterium]|nr:TIGR03435 family protein [Acidobacteriota bacterium]
MYALIPCPVVPGRALQIHTSAHILSAMCLRLMVAFAFLCSVVLAQPAAKTPAFEVASVRPSRVIVGPDYNNQITFTPDGFIGRNVTLKYLIAEAWNVQLNQVLGLDWLDRNEFDINARTAEGTTKEQMSPMLKSLLAERFGLKDHIESREIKVYELAIAKTGPKVRPIAPGEPVKTAPGLHFHGDIHKFCDLLAVQFSIPATEKPSTPARAGGPPILVLDKTRLKGIFDFSVDIYPELGTDTFTLWQRALEDQLGLKIESRRDDVPIVVVDHAAKIPTKN